jgi:hypothetical protein
MKHPLLDEYGAVWLKMVRKQSCVNKYFHILWVSPRRHRGHREELSFLFVGRRRQTKRSQPAAQDVVVTTPEGMLLLSNRRLPIG